MRNLFLLTPAAYLNMNSQLCNQKASILPYSWSKIKFSEDAITLLYFKIQARMQEQAANMEFFTPNNYVLHLVDMSLQCL